MIGESSSVATCLQRARDYYAAGNASGGALHIVLDDGNLEDSHLRFCLDRARADNDRDAETLALMMLELAPDQRQEVYERLHR